MVTKWDATSAKLILGSNVHKTAIATPTAPLDVGTESRPWISNAIVKVKVRLTVMVLTALIFVEMGSVRRMNNVIIVKEVDAKNA